MFKWIEKKDLFYWLLFVIMIYLLSSDIGQYDRFLLDNWAFAGTIVSIILAVIAILYTFDQSSTTVASTKKLEDSADRVEAATKELEGNNIRIVVDDLEDRLNKILREVKQGIQDDINENITNPLRDLVNLGKATSFDKNFNILSDEDWKKYIYNNIVKEDISTEGVTILYVYYLYVNDKIYSHEKTKKMLESIGYEKSLILLGCGVLQGQVRLLASLNVLEYAKFDEDTQVGKFTKLNEMLKNEIEMIVNKKEEKVIRLMEKFDDLFK
ncbi:hypothetical protein B1B04_18830 [Lysinibacillus sp. KCTC 33748]|uniref:hypothetical protein n=1 Tax=unclassified Lysinibacillus TaxID=2636778 RepID=UPI0009A80396|nr:MULTISPECIES: hypothetical protein [unclassified Lysinibacillus]OXS70219.1 hypothetical protein B1B04_18830 [Lysinibacillus sp. KCTC 33748]SKC04845.1 hypothetical protein SAMN06295926_11955 [Lysinibacillus sp. AC-3]